MEESIEYGPVALKDIACDGNRKWTKDEGFEQLANSVREHGIIEPPVLRRLAGGGYRVIAGRRRIEAARQLEYKEVWCKSLAEDDPRGDEEIALAENVNRAEMHPLDEAALFCRMAGRGLTAAEIAKYYARSPQAIYKRLRLMGLTDELKGMFRDGALSIESAAVLAELPEGDQEAFWGQYGSKQEEIPRAAVMTFVNKRQRFTVKESMEEGCAGCAKRTHNSGNDLFGEFNLMDDVCLDGDCYRHKWKAMIEGALAEGYNLNLPTDAKIIFRGAIPELLYKKAAHAEFFYADKETRFEIIKEKDCEITGETKRKKDACWLIRDSFGGLIAQRVGYKQKPPKEGLEAGGQGNAGGKAKNNPDKGEIGLYGREAMEAAAAERGTTPGELVQALEGSNVNSYQFKDRTGELVYEKVIEQRIAAEKSGAEPPRDYFSMFLQRVGDELYSESSFIEEEFDERQKQRYSELVGAKPLKKIAMGFDEETQALFHFLLLCIGFAGDELELDLDDLKKKTNMSKNLFWQYAGMGEDEYRALYLEAAKEAVAEALKPKPKKGGKKKAEAKEKQESVRTCRACGCTCDDKRFCEKAGGACYWVEEDLCGACADAAVEADRGDPDSEDGYDGGDPF